MGGQWPAARNKEEEQFPKIEHGQLSSSAHAALDLHSEWSPAWSLELKIHTALLRYFC